MKVLILITFIVFSEAAATGFLAQPPQIPGTFRNGSTMDAKLEPPIKISVLKYRWLRLTNEPGTEFNAPGQPRIKIPGMAMLREALNILYEKTTYSQDKVKLVTDVTIANQSGKLSSYQAGIERDVRAASGELWAVWVASGIMVSGRGVMEVYLTENKKKGKIISNTLLIPVAAGAAAERELEAEFGPWIVSKQPTR